MKLKEIRSSLLHLWFTAARHALQQAGLFVFMTGTFKRTHQEGGLRLTERLTISRISTMGEVYRIVKTISRMQKNADQVTLEEQYEEWKAVFDSATRQLVGIGNSRKCCFIPEKSLLLLGDVAYTKEKKEDDQ